MTDCKYEKLLSRLHKAFEKYSALRAEAEEEYKVRFGEYPSDVDDDFWIDTFYQSPVKTTFEEIMKNAKSIQIRREI